MRVSLLVALGKNREIGLSGKLLWHLSDDLINFKKLTLGHHIIMGRKTFDSIGKALPGRTTIVVTRNPSLQVEGVLVAANVFTALTLAYGRGESEAFVIGGGEIYHQALDMAQRLYVTEVEYSGKADTYFPAYKHLFTRELEVKTFTRSSKNQYSAIYRVLERTS